MGKILHVAVANKVATYCQRDGTIVCGNSDYTIEFAFDGEWADFPTKTARFVGSDGKSHDVVFTGNRCVVPVLRNIVAVSVGVFAGDLITCTPAVIECRRSILCVGGSPAPPSDDVYAQIMELLNAGGGGGGGGGIGITRANYSGSGNVTIEVQDQYVYYVTGYSNITVKLPDNEFSAYFFVSFPDDALSCSFNLPNGFPAFGNNLAECDFGENWEISIDSVGGALALRKRGL